MSALEPVRVSVLGSGRMGSALARDLVAAGHRVTIGSRDPHRAEQEAARIGAAAGAGLADACRRAEVVVLTVPWRAVADTLEAAAVPDGCVLVDATNPFLDDTYDGADPAWSLVQRFGDTGSAAQTIQDLVPAARVVKAWNHLYAEAAQLGYGSIEPAVFVCGDDPAARRLVIRLAADIGHRTFDIGPLANAHLLERLCELIVLLDSEQRALLIVDLSPAPAQVAAGREQ